MKLWILLNFNIHVNTPSCHLASEFLQILDCSNLRQHVDVPTHTKPNTLEPVIADSDPITAPSVLDHKVVSMELLLPSLQIKPKGEISFRNLKNIDTKKPGFWSSAHPPCADIIPHWICGLLQHNPEKRPGTFMHPSKSGLWLFPALLLGLQINFVKWRLLDVLLSSYTRLLDLLSTNWPIVNIKRPTVNPTNSLGHSSILASSKAAPVTLDSCSPLPLSPPSTSNPSTHRNYRRALQWFQGLLHNQNWKYSFLLLCFFFNPQPDTVTSLCCFPDITQQEVQNVIKRMKPSTCALDPFPAALVKAHTPSLTPLITMIIKQSRQTGNIPSALKTAITKPLLKKPTFDHQILANYRPISNLLLSKVSFCYCSYGSLL